MTRPGDLDPADQASLDAILASSPELATLTAHVRAFASMMTGRRGRELEPRMTAAAGTGEPALTSFVTGLCADQDAVTARLTLRWSSGSVEGHVNRIKMLKCQMYGRANPDLLRPERAEPQARSRSGQPRASYGDRSLHMTMISSCHARQRPPALPAKSSLPAAPRTWPGTTA